MFVKVKWPKKGQNVKSSGTARQKCCESQRSNKCININKKERNCSHVCSQKIIISFESVIKDFR